MNHQKIRTFLWFENQAEEAANFYVSIFKDSRIDKVVPGSTGSTLIVEFTLANVEYIAMNSEPHHSFTEAISLFVHCETQAEIDELWSRLTTGGKALACGWLKDQYGLCWQIIPSILPKYLADPDPAKASRVMDAMMRMIKLDIAQLQAAYDE